MILAKHVASYAIFAVDYPFLITSPTQPVSIAGWENIKPGTARHGDGNKAHLPPAARLLQVHATSYLLRRTTTYKGPHKSIPAQHT